MGMTVGAAAETAGVSAKAVRLWESKGLLTPTARTEAGYRLFTDEDMRVLRSSARPRPSACPSPRSKTSSTCSATAPPDPRVLQSSADTFLSAMPSASGGAPRAVRISRDGEPARLALGFPAAGQTTLLVLDDQGRIAEQTLASGKHLVRQRFVYPDPD